MSSSVFKVYDSSSRDEFGSDAGASGILGVKDNGLSKAVVHEDLKLDSNLVIVVNKDGSVSVDQATLQSLLANETNDTSVSVVRISSPTPSIEEEIEEEQRLLKEEKQKLDADADAASSNEDSNEDSAGTSSAASSVAGITTRRGRPAGKKSSGTMLLGDDDDPKHVSLTVEAYYPPSEASNFAAQVLSLTGYEHPLRRVAVDIEYLKQIVSNDHCYTPLSSPTQKLPPRTLLDDVDSSEESTTSKSKSDNTFNSALVGKFADVRKGISVKVNKTVPLPVLGAPSTAQNKLRKPATTSTGAVPLEQRKVSKPGKLVAKSAREIDDEDDDEDDDYDSDYSDEESSYSEDDDEMDADFSVTGRTTIKKRKQLVKNKVSPKALQRGPYRKSDTKEHAESGNVREADKQKHSKVIVKSTTPTAIKTLSQKPLLGKAEQVGKVTSAKKDVVRLHSSSSSSGSSTPTGVTSRQLLPGTIAGKLQTKPDPSQPKPPVTSTVTATATVTAPSIVVPKKEKKPKTNPHDAALFSDMSALFSTPDIIKKVNSGKTPTPATTPVGNNANVGSPMITTTGQSASTVVKMQVLTKPTEQKQAIASPLQTPTTTAQQLPNTEQRLDLIDAIVQEDLRQSSVPVVPLSKSGSSSQMQPTEIPNIVKMLEQTSTGSIEAGGAILTPLLPETKPIQPVVQPVVDLLPDTSILEALNSNDDALPEELLEHVAELAKNKELQEILDKQVLSVIGTEGLLVPPVIPMGGENVTNLLQGQPMVQEASTSIPPSIAFPIVPIQSVATGATLVMNSSEPVQQQPIGTADQPAQRKDAIQIRRSDGRLITLPPIEAPTTRASKRRAQGSDSSTPTTTVRKSIDQQSPVSVAGSSETTTIPFVTTPETPKPSRRPSVKVGTTPTSSRPVTPAVMIVAEGLNDQGDQQQAAEEALKTKRTSKVRQSVDNTRVKRASSTHVTVAIEAVAQDDDFESDESWNSEDDPDRLWCICRQPHNNRFMICCDSCEDWFHGKCVNITKAMGQQMEQDGIEWTCPNCLKKKQDRQQPKLMAFWAKTGDTGTAETATPASKPSPQATSISSAVTTEGNCVVCNKQAKSGSIYCSDECIRKHAANTVANSMPASKTEKSKERPNVASASVSVAAAAATDLSNDSQMVIVMERKTGRCLTGKNAPSLENLKSWLQAHPTFEVVPPSSQQGTIILKKQAAMRKQQLEKEAAEKKASQSANTVTTSTSGTGGQSAKIQTQLKFNEQKKIVISTATPSAAAVTTVTKSQNLPKILTTTSNKQMVHKASPSATSTSSHVVLGKGAVTPAAKGVSSPANQQKMMNVGTSSNSSTPTTTSAAPVLSAGISKQKKPMPATVPAASLLTHPSKQFRKSSTTVGGENIRVTVKKTLKEHLMQRTAEMQDDSTFTRLTEEEIDRFVEDTEHQMFLLFNKETGMKYRAKYRSLVFNIKDRKNLSLFQKISEKLIEPKQLVRMTADELASQELAQWREKEAKHQLEMIKKSELDLLACAKNYVLKTHKGEEVIEGKTDDRVQLDPSAPVEDVVLLLNNSAVSSTSELDDSSTAFPDGSHRSKDYDYGVYGKSYTGMYGGSGSISSSSSVTVPGGGKLDSHGSGGAGSSSSRKKESRRSSRSRSRGRKHERDRSRDRSRSKHKRKRSRDRSHEGHSSRDRERDRDRDRDRERDRERERDRDRHHKGRERSKERSKHEAKSSREKDTSSKSSSDKRRASTASRGAEAIDPNTAKDVPESERKVGKTSEAQSKATSGSSKKRVEVTKEATKLPVTETESDKVVESKEPNNPEAEQLSDSAALEKKCSTLEKNADGTKVAVEHASKDSKPDQDQEPSSTVTIPTPPHYPFEGQSLEEQTGGTVVDQATVDAEKNHWTGNVHMIDVASIEMSIRTVSGEIHDVAKDFTDELNICGTIKPEIVWEYIGQIKKSPNKEVCLVRFHSTEASAYYTLYNHLHSRKRYSVVKSPSVSIKDFYIFPLPADQMIPMILKPLRGIGIIEGDNKPNLLLGILVKIKGGKRPSSSNATNASVASKTVRHQTRGPISAAGGKPNTGSSASNKPSLMQQVITKYASKDPPNEANVPPKPTGSESGLKLDTTMVRADANARGESGQMNTPDTPVNDPMDMEIDMDIIKAPIAGKAVPVEGNSSTVGTSRAPETNPAMLIDDDDDEPYSPGGGSDDSNFADVTAIVDTSKVPRGGITEHGVDPDEERMRIAMEELNRKIAEQKNEIVGLISMADLKEDEINSALPPSLINDIPIPPNLSQILASIKGGGGGGSGTTASAAGIATAETADEVSLAPSASGMVSASDVEPMSVTSRSSEVPDEDDEEEYNPTTPALYGAYKAAASIPYSAIPIANSQGDIDERIIPATLLPSTVAAQNVVPSAFDPMTSLTTASEAVLANLAASLPSVASVSQPASGTGGESRLAKLSEAELLSMVPDDVILPDSSSKDS